MVTITLYTRQQKRHWCIEQSCGLCRRVRGWGDLGEWHWNMNNIIHEMSHQSRFDEWFWMLGAGALGQLRGMVWGGRREEGSDHLTCLLRNLYEGQEATIRTGHGTTDWFQIEKEYVKAVYCHPAYLSYMQSTSWERLGWKKHKLESDCREKYQ